MPRSLGHHHSRLVLYSACPSTEPLEIGNPYIGHHKHENKHQIGVHHCTKDPYSGITPHTFKGNCISEAVVVGSWSLQSCLHSWGLVFRVSRWTLALPTMKKYSIHTVLSTWKRLWRLVRTFAADIWGQFTMKVWKT